MNFLLIKKSLQNEFVSTKVLSTAFFKKKMFHEYQISILVKQKTDILH